MLIKVDTNGFDFSSIARDGKLVLIDAKETRDGCVLAIEPTIRIIENRPDAVEISKDLRVQVDEHEHLFLISKHFSSYYQNINEISLELKQRLRTKYLAFLSPKPFIIKTCKTKERTV